MSSREFTISVPARPESLKVVRACFASAFEELGASGIDDLLLALDEACANLIRHRRGELDDGRLCVTASAAAHGELAVRIDRFCSRQCLDGIKGRELDDVRPGGLGTRFIERIMDHVEFVPEAPGSQVLRLVMYRGLRPAGGEE